jgi:hypothetical protein
VARGCADQSRNHLAPTGIHACSEERPGREVAIMHLARKKRRTIVRFGRNFVQREAKLKKTAKLRLYSAGPDQTQCLMSQQAGRYCDHTRRGEDRRPILVSSAAKPSVAPMETQTASPAEYFGASSISSLFPVPTEAWRAQGEDFRTRPESYWRDCLKEIFLQTCCPIDSTLGGMAAR